MKARLIIVGDRALGVFLKLPSHHGMMFFARQPMRNGEADGLGKPPRPFSAFIWEKEL